MRMHFLGVALDALQIGRVGCELFTISRRVKVEGEPYLASFDFDLQAFDAFLDQLPKSQSASIRKAFSQAPPDASVGLNIAGDLGAVNIECKLGTLQENENEHYAPLVVVSVS